MLVKRTSPQTTRRASLSPETNIFKSLVAEVFSDSVDSLTDNRLIKCNSDAMPTILVTRRATSRTRVETRGHMTFVRRIMRAASAAAAPW